MSTNGSWRPHSCENSHRFVCQYSEDIITPIEGNKLSQFNSRTERQRNFDTLSPNAHHKDICGRRFVRQKRIVGGGIADYGEWPWQVSKENDQKPQIILTSTILPSNIFQRKRH